MRQKASELVKGEWYADTQTDNGSIVLLKFSHKDNYGEYFTEQSRRKYSVDLDGLIPFIPNDSPWYLPTPEDIEKYNLNEKE